MTDGGSRRALVVCYGGTFDPVHLGHLGAALDVVERSACDVLRVIPAALPPHRATPGASAEQRLRMLELAFAEAASSLGERVVIDALELERDGPSFTIDTLGALRRALGPEPALGWVLGTDALAGLERWHRWREIVDAAHLLVLERPGYPLPRDGVLGALVGERRVERAEELRAAAAGRLWCVGQRPVDVSATEVRERLRELATTGAAQAPPTGACDGLLSSSVWAYIRSEGLYGMRQA